MRRLLLLLLLSPPLTAWSAEEVTSTPVEGSAAQHTAADTINKEDPPITWVDEGHAYATDRAQELAEWMDGFFGDANYEFEKPESLLRLEWANTWDEQDDHKSRVRLRGKVRLPQLSERLNLVFSGEDGETVADGQVVDDSDGRAAFVYRVGEAKRSRVDLTLGMKWIGVKPGIRYRNQGPISEDWFYRYTQRLQWEDDEGFFTTGQFNLDHAISDDQLVRWSSRAIYGEETLGTEWSSGLSLRTKYETPNSHDPFVVSYFTTINGVSDPERVENYGFGVLFRRQMFRRYFFAELEPSYNFRKREFDEDRSGVWNIVLRFEILFETQRMRTRPNVNDEGQAEPPAPTTNREAGRSEVFLSEGGQP